MEFSSRRNWKITQGSKCSSVPFAVPTRTNSVYLNFKSDSLMKVSPQTPKEICNAKSKYPDAKSKLSKYSAIATSTEIPLVYFHRRGGNSAKIASQIKSQYYDNFAEQAKPAPTHLTTQSSKPRERKSIALPLRPPPPSLFRLGPIPSCIACGYLCPFSLSSLQTNHVLVQKFNPLSQSGPVRMFNRTVGMVTEGTSRLHLHERRHRPSLTIHPTRSHIPISSYIRGAQLYFHPWNQVHAH